MKKGIILVEVLLAVGILGLLLIPILDFFVTSLESSWFASREIAAQAILQEQLEAIRSVRERDWDELVDGSYYLTAETGRYELVESEDGLTEGQFTQKLEILPVYRNQIGGLVEETDPEAWLDPSTKKINVQVSWQSLRNRQAEASTYLTRLENLSWIQTTKAEFDQGEFELTKTVDPPQVDGEVILEGGCFSGNPESLIYDDQLRNGWLINCEGFDCRWWDWRCWLRYYICEVLQFISNAEITEQSADYTWDGSEYAMKIILKPSGWSWVRIHNFDAVCTKGFEQLHFYGYNPSDQDIDFYLTAHYEEWETEHIVLPPGEWTEITIEYETLEDYEESLDSLYFHKWMESGDPEIIFYLDQIELIGGIGGYFTEGTFTSSVFDAGRQTAFNRVAFTAQVPDQTEIGFQTATSSSADGPWLFYGPGGTTQTSDLYTTQDGEGVWLGNNFGRYFRYRAYLRSLNGEDTPTLEEVTINYSP